MTITTNMEGWIVIFNNGNTGKISLESFQSFQYCVVTNEPFWVENHIGIDRHGKNDSDISDWGWNIQKIYNPNTHPEYYL